MDTLTEKFGPTRTWDLIREARLSSLYGISVANMTNDEHLATIGYLSEHIVSVMRHLEEIKGQVEQLAR